MKTLPTKMVGLIIKIIFLQLHIQVVLLRTKQLKNIYKSIFSKTDFLNIARPVIRQKLDSAVSAEFISYGQQFLELVS